MKINFLLLLLLTCSLKAICQDSTAIVFKEEIDSLPPVRFIDRYENIFMTKVPTRHMLKVGLSQYIQSRPFALYNDKGFKNSNLQIGYEFKFLPAYSIAISGQMPLFGNAIPKTWIIENISVNGQLRWYYDMKKRIMAGKSANNFSGNYLAAEYIYLNSKTNMRALGLRMGFQRRFLNSGFIDFNIGLRKGLPIAQQTLSAGWGIFTEVSFGFAIGDWKKTSNPSICQLIRCDLKTKQHWKVQIPDIKFGQFQKTLGIGIAYELALGKSPLSLNFQYNLNLQKAGNYLYGYFSNDWHQGWFARDTRSKEASQLYSIQPRYYFTQKAQQRKGKGGNGLSGFYSGINLEYAIYRSSHIAESIYDTHIDVWTPEYTFKVNRNYLGAGPLIGVQQRLFKNGYIDFNTSCNWGPSKEMGFTYNVIRVRANLTVGFRFGS
ncbi:hypothetical protein [Dyadobacter sp. NIV53]|uniref:hypothetical protein n=1 Tax=Dyadobacter sp. NIV53 TaxID=2861765 RepID=UPI001C876829|nr:hypothetical protein [Dyadobacter sp. NIV53]